MKQISVLLADDHAFVLSGLRALLGAEVDLEVVGEAKNGRQAVEMTMKLRPAVVVMDISMPLLNGLEATRIILKSLPATKVLILSTHKDEDYVQHAAEIGAVGYLLKQSSANILADAIRDAHAGRMCLFTSTARRRDGQQSQRSRKKR